MSYSLTMPGRTVLGENALETSEHPIRALGKKAFVVTGKNVARSGAVARLAGLLADWNLEYEVFDGIAGEPTHRMIEEGVAAYRRAGCDFIIGIGGGSPLDSAKAVAAMTALPGRLPDYSGVSMEGDFPPLALIPTTAGTGSEATKFAVITDADRSVKMLLKGDALLPDLAVVDPSFALTAPGSVIAATGMDALTHAVEAYTSRRSNPVTDILALDAIRRIFRYLPVSYRNRNDRKAREEMALAAYEAGVCINNASVTLVHGMSRPIGALFHIPHGISNAMLIKDCLAYALDGCYERFAAIARANGAAGENSSDRDAAKAFLDALGRLSDTLEIPTLEEYGVDRTDFDRAADKMAEDALASGSPGNTLKAVSREAIRDIYARLW